MLQRHPHPQGRLRLLHRLRLRRSLRITLEALITPKTRDLGDGFAVRRALPAVEKRTVGPFVFFDQMGPVALAPGKGLDVRPHPHIGLATLTYLFEGEIDHRDSLGTVQPIRPGEVNWMTAGRGIAHSERTPQRLRAAGSRVFGIQMWIGLPTAHEETEPAFSHHKADALPVISTRGMDTRLVAGRLFGRQSPVKTFSPMFCADVALKGGEIAIPPAGERAAYVASGSVEHEGATYDEGRLLVFGLAGDAVLRGTARVLLIGGEPLDGPRRLWWNFVSSRKERIAQAAADWKAGRFAPVPGETELIPLPDDPPTAERPSS